MLKTKQIISAIMAVIAVFSLIWITTGPTKSIEHETNSSSKNQTTTTPGGYKITEYEGKIAVFAEGSQSPIYILDSPYLRDLPTYDQNLIKNGIYAATDKDVQKIIEDYDG